jgi:hypothetical protein
LTRIASADFFRPFAECAKGYRSWRYYEMDSSHSPHITAPEKLATLLGTIVAQNV